MTLQQILYALTIEKEGTMNKAAESLFIAQPTLSSAIKELEKELNIQIFERHSKGVKVTNEGRVFLDQARQIYSQFEVLKENYGPKSNLKHKFGVSTQHYSFAIKAFVEMVKRYDTVHYEFAIRETKTMEVIQDVANLKSEIGILYLSNQNEKYIRRLLEENGLEFHFLHSCNAQVYLFKDHPLASQKSITLEMLQDYPCLSFEQGNEGLFYLAEEILTENQYERVIKTNDRATMLNLMVGLNGYTLCSGIICDELNGSDYICVPYDPDEDNPNSNMEIGYIQIKNSILSSIGETYIAELKNYFN